MEKLTDRAREEMMAHKRLKTCGTISARNCSDERERETRIASLALVGPS